MSDTWALVMEIQRAEQWLKEARIRLNKMQADERKKS